MSIFEMNLAALGRVDGGLARRVQGVSVPMVFQRVLGVDGVGTFLRVLEGAGRKRMEWLGGSSMVSASAGGIVSGLDAASGGANGLGLGIGSGFEWKAFVGRFGVGQAVFVYEPWVEGLRMALEVCDLAEEIGNRKLVLLSATAEEAGGRLVEILEGEGLGLDVPTVMHPLPTLGGRRNEMLGAGEMMVRRAVLRRAEKTGEAARKLREITERLRSMLSGPSGLGLQGESKTEPLSMAHGGGMVHGVGVIAMTVGARYLAERPLHGEVRRHGWEEVRVDRHDSTSAVYRMERLSGFLERCGKESGKGVRVVSDLFRGQLAVVPGEMGVETWVPPLAGAGYFERVEGAWVLEGDVVVVHCAEHRAKLVGRGVMEGRIVLRGAVLPARSEAVTESGTLGFPSGVQAGGFSLRHRVALVGDLGLCSAEALGVVLPTPLALYGAARGIMEEEWERMHGGMADDVVRRALGRAGVSEGKAWGDGGRAGFLRMVRDVLMPAVVPMACVRALVAEAVAVTVVGEWPEMEAGGMVKKVGFGEVDGGDFWGEVAVLAQLSPLGLVSPLVWEAVERGVAVVTEGALGDGLGEVLTEKGYVRARAGGMVGVVKGLLRNGEVRQRLVEEGAKGVGLLRRQLGMG